MERKIVIFSVLAVLLLIFAVWTVWGNITVGTTRYRISGDRLPAPFDGYKIAVVSDLHNARFGKDNSRIIDCVSQAAPDMIAFTGDLIDSHRPDMDTAVDLVSDLLKIAPCYYVTGNHEMLIGDRFQALEERLASAGVIILHDQTVRLMKGGQTVQIAGVDDPSFITSDTDEQKSVLQSKLRRMHTADDYCILLSHHPEAFHVYADEGLDLVLCGHAHGGQFRLPFVGGVVAPNQGWFPKYDAGVYAQGNTAMIVSRGVGNSVIPVRLNNRPEIVIVELNCK